MMETTKQRADYAGCNLPLLKAVPGEARRILEVGCAESSLGRALKEQNPERYVAGIEIHAKVAEEAARHLDRVWVMDVEQSLPEIEPRSLDCIIFDDVLEHLVNPGDVLEQVRPLLSPSGVILCCIPNFQHHSVLTALLSGDFQYTDEGIVDSTHLRFFTLSTMQKLLLDAGYEPRRIDTIEVPAPKELELAQLVKPLSDAMGLNHARTMNYLQAYQYIIEGKPIPLEDTAMPAEPLSIVVCVSNETILQANLLASPDLNHSEHEVILVRNCRNAAEGLNRGLEMAKNSLVVFAHQDVYLPKGWTRRLVCQYRKAERTFGEIGIAGVYGIENQGSLFFRAGNVVSLDCLLKEKRALPALVNSLDELLLVAPKSTPIRFDTSLGFHFYGTDFCLSAKSRRLPCVALDAICLHNTRNYGLNDAFFQSATIFLSKWRGELPLATSCVLFTPQGEMEEW